MPPKSGEEKLNRALCKAGSKVFYWEPNHAWALGTVEGDDGKNFKVSGYDVSCTKVESLQTVDKCPETKIWPLREDVLDEDCDDLLSLTILHDSTIQRCLYVRYMKDTPYTNIGAITVALNPWNFKIPKYMDAKMPDYLAEGEVIRDNVPHSWAQAHNTYYELRRDAQDQCILISGESGAGKTEAAKIVMKYMGAVSCMQGTDSEKEAAKKVAFNINQASPILEGFGNAKTVRNDNSSRFGKFMKVQFDSRGLLVGAFTVKYLLEKSRIITANPNERIYHAFYLVTKGKDAGKYHLKGPGSYSTCTAGGCIEIPKVDDGEDYSICLEAMHNCGFSPEQQDGVWRMCAGALHLGEVRFKAIDADTSEIDASTAAGVQGACDLWMIDAAVATKELTLTTVESRGEVYEKKLNQSKATDGRDSLVRTTYDNMFGWQVLTINGITDSGTGQNFVGLLDIFGFEDFEYNSFEQLCINLANETLQNHYNKYIFNKDMDECRAEGVDVTEVSCPDNGPCLKLMTDKAGVFGKLDDESNMGSGTDKAFLEKIKDSFEGKHPFFGVKKLSRDSFIIHHYAGSVNYTVESWLEKNRDSLKPAWKLAMRASGQELLRELLPEPDESAKKITVGGFFKLQLTEMMDLINSTNPHWIRCVKPHPAKKPLLVNGITMMNQLDSSGVLGTVKIRKAGFPVRPNFKNFCARFKIIMGVGPKDEAGMKDWCKSVCDKVGIDPMKAQVGKSKMFLKTEANQALEAAREEAQLVHRKNAQNAGRLKVRDIAARHAARAAKISEIQRLIREEAKGLYARRAAQQKRYDDTGLLPGVAEPEAEPEPEPEPDPDAEANAAARGLQQRILSQYLQSVRVPGEYDASLSDPADAMLSEFDAGAGGATEAAALREDMRAQMAERWSQVEAANEALLEEKIAAETAALEQQQREEFLAEADLLRSQLRELGVSEEEAAVAEALAIAVPPFWAAAHDVVPPVAWCSSEKLTQLARTLMGMWRQKKGTVVDELVANADLPRGASPALDTLSYANTAIHAQQSEQHPDRSALEMLLAKLSTMRGPDLDRLWGWLDAPPARAVSRKEWDAYAKQRQEAGRNPAAGPRVPAGARGSVHDLLCWAASGMAEQGESGGSRGAEAVRWVKLLSAVCCAAVPTPLAAVHRASVGSQMQSGAVALAAPLAASVSVADSLESLPPKRGPTPDGLFIARGDCPCIPLAPGIGREAAVLLGGLTGYSLCGAATPAQRQGKDVLEVSLEPTSSPLDDDPELSAWREEVMREVRKCDADLLQRGRTLRRRAANRAAMRGGLPWARGSSSPLASPRSSSSPVRAPTSPAGRASPRSPASPASPRSPVSPTSPGGVVPSPRQAPTVSAAVSANRIRQEAQWVQRLGVPATAALRVASAHVQSEAAAADAELDRALAEARSKRSPAGSKSPSPRHAG